MDRVTDLVGRQYTAFAYPQPYADVAAHAAAGNYDLGDPSAFGPLFWPEGGPAAPSILVAGCGTVQAAMLAYRNPNSRIVGVDLSEVSLAHERFLRDKHGLANLELYQGDLREVGKLGERFDLIVSSGVLHHLQDPSEGLRALEAVLAPRGAMCLMVYGKLGRAGVYPLQDAFRRLGLGQTSEDVAAVRQMLSALPPDHLARIYFARTGELEHDTAIVDTFLHPQDVAYTVPEVLGWLRANGLEHQGWMVNQLYYPDMLVAEPARSRVRRLPEEQQWCVVESLLALAGTHTFVARRPEDVRRLAFTPERLSGLRPIVPPTARLAEVRKDGGGTVTVIGSPIDLAQGEVIAFSRLDGRRSLREIIDEPPFAAFPEAERLAFGAAFLQRMWKCGAVMVQETG